MSTHDNHGFTLVETAISITLSGLLIAIIIAFMLNGLTRYGIANARSELLNDAQSALDVTTTDIRLSANADANNRWDDTNSPGAPSDTLSWESSSSILVLATAAQDTSGNIIFSDASKYISAKNNIIYFVSDRKLYKRVLAAPVTGNSTKTTCPSASATTSCPADKLLISNVDTFTVKYFDSQNVEVSADTARSVELYIKLKVVRYPQSVFAEYKTRMAFRNG